MIQLAIKQIETIIIRELESSFAERCAKIFNEMGLTKKQLVEADKKITGMPLSYVMDQILVEMEKLDG